jgi:hypothetical protein
MTAYLAMMAVRLVELHRVLRPDGEPLPEDIAGCGVRGEAFSE